METNTSKTITLNDLKSNGQQPAAGGNLVPVNQNDILPSSKKEDPVEKKMDSIMGDVDKALERKFNYVDEKRAEIIEELAEKNLEAEGAAGNVEIGQEGSLLGGATSAEPKKNFVTATPAQSGSIFIDETDIEEDDEEENKTNQEQQLESIKTAIKEKIKPVTNVVDLASFTISKKPVSVLNSLKTNMTAKKTVDWVLPATGIGITMDALSGFEIQKLDPRSSGKNRFNTYREIYGILLEHVIDGNKPRTIEEWVKLINFFDIDHLYFTAYKASFDGANSLPYSCPHCKEIFMKDTPIDEMIKYKTEEFKKQMQEILQKDTTSPSEYNVELIQISEDHVIGFREPSVYNVIFENVVLDENFTEKYSELLSLLAYVDSVYYINRETNELQPIELKEYPNNAVKTIKNRVVKYSQVLQTLTSDQFYAFNAYIKAINDRHDEMTYIIPEAECPKCKKVIPEQEMSAETLLFTRHQLAGIANT